MRKDTMDLRCWLFPMYPAKLLPELFYSAPYCLSAAPLPFGVQVGSVSGGHQKSTRAADVRSRNSSCHFCLQCIWGHHGRPSTGVPAPGRLLEFCILQPHRYSGLWLSYHWVRVLHHPCVPLAILITPPVESPLDSPLFTKSNTFCSGVLSAMSVCHAQLPFHPMRTILAVRKHSKQHSVPGKEDHPIWIRIHIYSVTSLDLSFSNCRNENDGFLQLCANVQCEHNTEWKAVNCYTTFELQKEENKVGHWFLPDR